MEYFTCFFFLIFFSYTIYLGQSVQFRCSVMSDSLRPHGLQHTRLPCPPLSPEACSNSCPSSHLVLCHPLLLLTSVFPSIRVFSNESTLNQANILELQLEVEEKIKENQIEKQDQVREEEEW